MTGALSLYTYSGSESRLSSPIEYVVAVRYWLPAFMHVSRGNGNYGYVHEHSVLLKPELKLITEP